MASLNGLPDELLLMISLQPEDLLTTMLVDHRMRDIYTPLLYKTVKLDHCFHGPGIDRMICFLRTIISTPRLAAHVHNLRLQDWMWRTHDPMFHIDQTTATSRLQSRTQYQKRGREHIQVGRDDVVPFLLSNLPELRKLTLRGWQLCDVIAGATLANVTDIRLESSGKDGLSTPIPVSELRYIMKLPRLKNLTLNRLFGKAERPEALSKEKLHTSTVVALCMGLEATSETIFVALFGIPAQLQSLVLTRAEQAKCLSEHPRIRGVTIHDRTISRALECHKTSLRSLVINGTKPCHSFNDKLDSLDDFPRLTEITLPPQLSYCGQEQSDRVRKLSHLLPASLETLILDCYPSNGYASVHLSWSDIVQELALRARQPVVKSITIRIKGKMQRMKCKYCDWSAVVCSLCVEMNTFCELCYNGPGSQKMEKACMEARIAL